VGKEVSLLGPVWVKRFTVLFDPHFQKTQLGWVQVKAREGLGPRSSSLLPELLTSSGDTRHLQFAFIIPSWVAGQTRTRIPAGPGLGRPVEGRVS
jgi:hypothetical protein